MRNIPNLVTEYYRNCYKTRNVLVIIPYAIVCKNGQGIASQIKTSCSMSSFLK